MIAQFCPIYRTTAGCRTSSWPSACGLSPSACLRRVRNLEASGAIAGYHAVIDPAAVGRGFEITVHATLMLRNRETIEAFEAAVGAAR